LLSCYRPTRGSTAVTDHWQRPRQALLGQFLEAYIANRKPTAAANTIKNLEQAKRRLLDYFGPDRNLTSIAPAEAWAAHLAGKYAPATVGRTVKRARQFFRAALRYKLVTENPFADLKAGGQVNRQRLCFVSPEVIYRAIEAAPDAEWRLIIALSRFGGLHCPSEHLALRWEDVLWDRNRPYVPSP
jgi:integrase